MNRKLFKVEGVSVTAQGKNRTIRLDVILKGGPDLTLEMPLPTATRLTDQLVDAEFRERRAHELSPEATIILNGAAPDQPLPAEPERRQSFIQRLALAFRSALRSWRQGSHTLHA
jgi:hypothetical protein